MNKKHWRISIEEDSSNELECGSEEANMTAVIGFEGILIEASLYPKCTFYLLSVRLLHFRWMENGLQ